MKKFALDVDGVCLHFDKKFIEVCKNQNILLNTGKIWNFFDQNRRSYDIFNNLKDDFWLELERHPKSLDLNSVPSAYISHRSCPEEVTRQSLLRNGFPDAPVIHVKYTEDKLKVFKNLNLDIFIDDRASTVLYFLENSIESYLLDQIYNEDFNLPRIKTLGDIKGIINVKDKSKSKSEGKP